jgi:hypothetical protein
MLANGCPRFSRQDGRGARPWTEPDRVTRSARVQDNRQRRTAFLDWSHRHPGRIALAMPEGQITHRASASHTLALRSVLHLLRT